ncbi:HAD family hydrolase [Epibacterium sp. Ofav1-8]|uniref:HAD family hydrolase n=1 Tax=Epibacterium sp. Ofav1-8 TaxID=2917735 RepID=UPI00351DA903
MPAAYLFDMDGLLLDTEQLTLDAFLDCGPEFDLDPHEMQRFFMGLIGTAKAQGEQMVREFIGPERDFEALDQAWQHHSQKRLATGIPIKPTVADTLAALHADGHAMAVVTSTLGDKARHHLDRAGLLPCFRAVIGGDEVPANKPDPAPYVQGAERLGAAPGDCAAFEDSDLGITAAARAGCFAVQIPDLRPVSRAFPAVGQRFAPTLKEAVATAQAHFQQTRRTVSPAE